MRGKLAIFALGLLAISAFVASPFVTAWQIREAIRNGDAAYLETRLDWPRVKDSLKSSMTTYALGNQTLVQDTSTAAAAPRPGLWQRFKNAAGRRIVASMVDNMATPASLTRLFTYRKAYNEKVRGLPDERTQLTLLERIKRSWSRVVRAEFLSPTRFAMEMRDKAAPDRSYAGILELQGATWRLVHLEVKRADDATKPRSASASAAAGGLWRVMKEAAIR
jgi:hypothetical protein